MTPIEQVREAGNAMRHWAERTYEEADRVARGYRVLEPLNSATESLKKRIKEWDRALSLLKTMEGEPVAISIRQDVQTIDMLCRIHKVIQEFREPTRKTVFYCPVGGQAERLAELHDELDLWLKTETIRATDPPQSDTLTTPPLSMTEEAMPNYDAGLLNDFGGGNVEWWQDYLRAELGRSEQFYQEWYASTHTKTITVDKCVHCGRLRSIPDDANP